MSEYCSQCSIALFGVDYGDCAGLSTPQDTEAGRFVPVLCEGCGFARVDHEGKCVGGCMEPSHQRVEAKRAS